MTESEKTTRKQRIDSKLTSSLLSWKVIPWSNGLDTDSLTAHAVEEYPTKTGPADYAMFVNGKLLGVIEANRRKIEGVFEVVRTRFADVSQTDLYSVIDAIYSFRNEYVAHQDRELGDSELAKQALMQWSNGLHRIWSCR